jgi:hypothetical protein
VPNGGKSHVTLIDFAFSLHHFPTLFEIFNKSHCKMSNEELLIDYNKSIMMMNGHYPVILKQKKW